MKTSDFAIKAICLIFFVFTSAQVLANSKAQIFDFLLTQQRATGTSLSGGIVYFYEPGTTTLKTVWTSRDKTTVAANPYTLSSDGTAAVYGDGLYDVKITTSAGVQKYYWYGIQVQDYLTSGAYQAIDADYSSLNHAIRRIGSTKTTLTIRTKDFPVTASVAVPSTLTLDFKYPGSLAVGSYTVSGLAFASPEWFGTNTTPGTTDMTAAIDAAIDAVSAKYGRVLLSTDYLISSTLTVPTGVDLEGLGPSITRLYKSAAMTTTGVVMDGYGSGLEKLAVMCDLGATGDGIQIANANVVLRDLVVHGAGKATPSGNGIRIGKDTLSNSNHWLLDNVSVRGMSGHGVHVNDFVTASGPNANAGKAFLEVEDCGGDGVYEENGYANTYVGLLSQGNVNGIHFGGGSYYSSLLGGDRENNSGSDILIDAPTGVPLANQISLIGTRIGETITDNGVATRRLDRYVAKHGTWTPRAAGTVSDGTYQYALQNGTWFRDGDYVNFQGAITFSNISSAATGNVVIKGIPAGYAPADLTGTTYFSAAISQWGGITLDSGYTQLGIRLDETATYFLLTQSGSNKAASAISPSNLSNSSQIFFQIRYPITSF